VELVVLESGLVTFVVAELVSEVLVASTAQVVVPPPPPGLDALPAVSVVSEAAVAAASEATSAPACSLYSLQSRAKILQWQLQLLAFCDSPDSPLASLDSLASPRMSLTRRRVLGGERRAFRMVLSASGSRQS
jgi:hypothetical protein